MIRSLGSAVRETGLKGAWALFIAIAYLAVFAVPDASFWYQVNSVYVHDTPFGETPRLEIDRIIHRPFDGSYRVELERKMGDRYVGNALLNPPGTGNISYNKDAELPDPITLDWWAYPQKWRPSIGTYRIETCWTIKPDWWWPRRLCVKSNDFKIY